MSSLRVNYARGKKMKEKRNSGTGEIKNLEGTKAVEWMKYFETIVNTHLSYTPKSSQKIIRLVYLKINAWIPRPLLGIVSLETNETDDLKIRVRVEG